MSNMKNSNYIISVVTFIIGCIIVGMSSQFDITFGQGDPGPGFWPMILGIILVCLSIVLAITTIKDKKKLEENVFTLTLPANIRVYIMMAITILFCVILYIFGFFIAAAIFIVLVMSVLEVKDKKKIALVTALTLLGIYVIFHVLLNISLPAPIFMR